MFILFHAKTGILHLSLYSLKYSSILRGIFFVNSLKNESPSQPEKEIYFFSTDLIAFKHKTSLPDYRITIHSVLLRKIFVSFILILNTPKKLKKSLLVLSFVTFIAIMISIPNGIYIQKQPSNFKTKNWNTQEWIDFFIKSEIAKKTSIDKNKYYSGPIPKIKSIDQFSVIPLNSHTPAFLVLPFKEITVVQSKNEFFIKKPTKLCLNQSMQIFKIDSQDKIVIFDQINKIKNLSLEGKFYIFSQTDFSLDSICPFFEKKRDEND